MNWQSWLESKGWKYVDTTVSDPRHSRRFDGPTQQISWYRKLGRMFPMHFAIWLEQHGWQGQF